MYPKIWIFPKQGKLEGGEQVEETEGRERDVKFLSALTFMYFNCRSWDLKKKKSQWPNIVHNVEKFTLELLDSFFIASMISVDAGKLHTLQDVSPKAWYHYGMCLGTELSFKSMDVNSEMPSNLAYGLWSLLQIELRFLNHLDAWKLDWTWTWLMVMFSTCWFKQLL